MISLTGLLPNDTKMNAVNYLTHSVYLDHYCSTKFNPTKVSKLAKT